MKKINSILWGALLIAVGVLLILNVLDILTVNLFFDGWWTLFLIVPCTIGLFTEHDKVGNLIGIGTGVLFLLWRQEVLSFGDIWKLILPIVIILIGLKMLFSNLFGGKSAEVKERMKKNGEPLKSYAATFSGQNVSFDNEPFTGASLNAVFGGIKCDLRQAIFEQDSVLEVSAIFGGVDILLPDHVKVKVNSNAIFGGVTNKKQKNTDENAITVFINGTALFGGVDIK